MPTIYALKRKGQIFYIGSTTHLWERVKEHFAVHGRDIEYEVLETCTGKNRHFRECYWIQRKSREGHILINKVGYSAPTKAPPPKRPKVIEDKDLPKEYLRSRNRLK